MACYVHEQSELNVAGPEGIEPPTKVLETSIMPFNYGPKFSLLYMICGFF